MITIVWKSFLANIKNYLAFFISVIMTVNILFLLMYIKEALSHVRGIETTALAFQYSSDLAKTLRTIIPAIILIAILVIAYSVRFYIQSRMKDYSIMTLLGISQKDMRLLIIGEYTLSCIVSCLLGLLLGNGCMLILRKILIEFVNNEFASSIQMAKVYGLTFLLCILMISGALIAIFVMLDGKDLSTLIKQNIEKENRNTTKKSLFWLLLGIILIIFSIFIVHIRPTAASFALFALCIGLTLCILLGFGYLLECFRKSETYRMKILQWDQFYHYFNKNKFRILIQSLTGILIIYFSFLMLRSNLEPRLMPNDFVCITEENSTFLTDFKKNYPCEEVSFPFVWVNENGGNSLIGISLNDYNTLYHKNESLNENEVIYIWRIEGSNNGMISTGSREVEGLSLGKCLNVDYEGAKFVHDFKIKKEFSEELIGFSIVGMVVLPDNVFQSVTETDNFHQMFYILNVPETSLISATDYIEKQKDDGYLLEAFCRTTISDADNKEKILDNMIVAIVVLSILFFNMFITWLSLMAETDSKREKYQFLSISGMTDSDRKRVIKKETGRIIWLPMLLTVLFGGLFCGTFVSAYYAGQTLFDASSAFCLLTSILLVYIISEIIFLQICKLWSIKQCIINI